MPLSDLIAWANLFLHGNHVVEKRVTNEDVFMNKSYKVMLTVFTVLLAVGTNVANSQGRPDSRRMTCDQAYNLVQRHGAVVMSTGRHTFERVVANQRWCQFEEVTERFYVPTRDDRRCRVGYKCTQGGLFDRD